MSYYIPIICGSTRRERQSIKVAKFVLKKLQERKGVETELLDLFELNFPIMEERLHRRDDPPPGLKEFGEKIGRADSFIIVTPEYNNGYPGGLKNALDYLLLEYERKPVQIANGFHIIGKVFVIFTGIFFCRLVKNFNNFKIKTIPQFILWIYSIGIKTRSFCQTFTDDVNKTCIVFINREA